MNDPGVLMSMFTFLGLVVVAVQNIVLHWRQTAIATNVEKIEKATNSMMEKREVAAEKLGLDKGVAQERAAQMVAPPKV